MCFKNVPPIANRVEINHKLTNNRFHHSQDLAIFSCSIWEISTIVILKKDQQNRRHWNYLTNERYFAVSLDRGKAKNKYRWIKGVYSLYPLLKPLVLIDVRLPNRVLVWSRIRADFTGNHQDLLTCLLQVENSFWRSIIVQLIMLFWWIIY